MQFLFLEINYNLEFISYKNTFLVFHSTLIKLLWLKVL